MRFQKLYLKTSRNDQHFGEIGRIQNQFTKRSTLSTLREVMETLPFTKASKELGKDLSNDLKDHYNETFKTMKRLRKAPKKWKDIPWSWLV